MIYEQFELAESASNAESVNLKWVGAGVRKFN